jgi:hypothetical protein
MKGTSVIRSYCDQKNPVPRARSLSFPIPPSLRSLVLSISACLLPSPVFLRSDARENLKYGRDIRVSQHQHPRNLAIGEWAKSVLVEHESRNDNDDWYEPPSKTKCSNVLCIRQVLCVVLIRGVRSDRLSMALLILAEDRVIKRQSFREIPLFLRTRPPVKNEIGRPGEKIILGRSRVIYASQSSTSAFNG